MAKRIKAPSDRQNPDDSREFARESLLVRVRLREYTLISFVLASSPLFAVAVHSDKYDILFAIPYMSVAFALQVLRYELSITRLSFYLGFIRLMRRLSCAN